MKRIVFLVITLCAAFFAQAQTIHVDHKFWDGYSLYTVKEIRMGKYIYMTTKQDEELTLEKVKEGEFKIIRSRQAEECPFGAEFGWRVQFIRQDGESFLAIRKPNGDVMYTLSQTTNNEDECVELQMMMGQEEPWNAVNNVLLNRAYLQNNVSTKRELRILRNKILAYHGYRFQSKDLQEYFGKIRWYKPVNDNNAIKLNIIEQTNIQLIKSEEAERPDDLTYANMDGIYDCLDENMSSVSRISLNADGTATWCMVGSLNYTEYIYRIEGNTICMKVKGVDSEEECYEYDSDTRTLKNEQGAVYYRQVAE